MDWELYNRFRATLGFVGVVLISLLFLTFQQSFPVQLIKTFLVRGVLPTERFLSHLTHRPVNTYAPVVPNAATVEGPLSQRAVGFEPDERRALKVLGEENRHLRGLLELKKDRWPQAVIAQVVARDPRRWFREVLLDKGSEEGLALDDPVLAVEGTREGLMGRIIEVGPHVSKVMLLQDPLSAVPATVSGSDNEDGLVEGTDHPELNLRYLRRDSPVKIGDLVITSGLGGAFTAGIPIGWVQDIAPDSSQLFLEARVRPAILSHPQRLVFVLVKHE